MSEHKGYLLDTNVVSETRKARANPNVLKFISAAHTDCLFISVLTLGELHKGIAARRRTDNQAAARLAEWVAALETSFANRILPFDPPAARIWGELSSGRTLPVIDSLLAAMALARGLALVTRNTRDFVSTGVSLIDPWHCP